MTLTILCRVLLFRRTCTHLFHVPLSGAIPPTLVAEPAETAGSDLAECPACGGVVPTGLGRWVRDQLRDNLTEAVRHGYVAICVLG